MQFDVSGMSNLLGLVFGGTPSHRVGQEITVCTVDGCMAHILTERYRGKIAAKTRIRCHGASGDGKIPAVEITVTECLKSDVEVGSTTTEIVANMRALTDGTLIIAN